MVSTAQKLAIQQSKVDRLEKQLAEDTGKHPHDLITARLVIIKERVILGLLITSKK